jgi:hypothetical protein
MVSYQLCLGSAPVPVSRIGFTYRERNYLVVVKISFKHLWATPVLVAVYVNMSIGPVPVRATVIIQISVPVLVPSQIICYVTVTGTSGHVF